MMGAKEIKEITETYWRPNISNSELEVIVEISFKAGREAVLADLASLAIGSGDINLQSYVVGLLSQLREGE